MVMSMEIFSFAAVDEVISPTYTINRAYEKNNGDCVKNTMFDIYRKWERIGMKYTTN